MKSKQDTLAEQNLRIYQEDLYNKVLTENIEKQNQKVNDLDLSNKVVFKLKLQYQKLIDNSKVERTKKAVAEQDKVIVKTEEIIRDLLIDIESYKVLFESSSTENQTDFFNKNTDIKSCEILNGNRFLDLNKDVLQINDDRIIEEIKERSNQFSSYLKKKKENVRSNGGFKERFFFLLLAEILRNATNKNVGIISDFDSIMNLNEDDLLVGIEEAIDYIGVRLKEMDAASEAEIEILNEIKINKLFWVRTILDKNFNKNGDVDFKYGTNIGMAKKVIIFTYIDLSFDDKMILCQDRKKHKFSSEFFLLKQMLGITRFDCEDLFIKAETLSYTEKKSFFQRLFG